ncbi:hypothetical protein [Pseudoxanthomonas sp.]|jgi:hypothetical protein|uniref:hypothetical protein n=1 Tax=Pseudoxanthomonas sp. TaxID=1871049 RepID=UPI002FE0E01A
MNARIAIALPIYAGLILRDLEASISNPMINAQRALLFADALLLCDASNNPGAGDGYAMEIQVQAKDTDGDQAILVRAAKARFASQLDSRRGKGRGPAN